MAKTVDAIIIGAGVMGASAAMHLARAGLRKLLVVEKGPGPASGSTGKSSACIRQTYSNPEVTVMAREALDCFKHWPDFTGLGDSQTGFVNCGVLFLFGPQDSAVPEIMRIHKQAGVKSSVLSQETKRSLFPDVDFSAPPPELLEQETDYEMQAIHEHEGGFADPLGTATDMLRAAGNLGAELVSNTRLLEIHQKGGKVSGATLRSKGQLLEVQTPLIISCAGPWTNEVLRIAGVSLPQRLAAVRAQIVSKQFVEPLKGSLPMIADMSLGFYGRMEANGRQFIMGSVLESDELEEVPDPDHYNEVADASFREEKLGLLHHRIATFEKRGGITSYAGLYTVNRTDYHPIIDGTALSGFFVACGFSGHGFKLSPLVGTLISKKVLGQWGACESEVPENFFDKDRQPLTTNWGGVIA